MNGPVREPTAGQVLVIFALSAVLLLAAAGIAFDIGRFYSERRFLQNAADAGALAVATALTQGATSTDAEARGRDVLARNFIGSPNGSSPTVATVPVYDAGFSGVPAHLASGILIQSNGNVRVAVQSDVSYTFGRVIGLGLNRIGAQARVKTEADMLPIAVRHYVNAPGPTVGAASPCSAHDNDFQDLLSTADTACLGSSTSGSLRTAASPGLGFDNSNPSNDTSHHGPIVALVGDDAKPANNASFRGFIALDIRNFGSSSSNVFYNNVTSGTQQNVLKAKEAAYVASGYDGPPFPPATSPPDPNDQVAIMDGNSAGIVVDAIDDRFTAGDEFMAAVYSGTVMTIPDFSLTVPSTVTIGTTQSRPNAVTMALTKNNAFAGVVTTTSQADTLDPASPYGTTLLPPTFSPVPATPSTTVTWATFQTVAAPVGIHTLWIKAHSSSPYLTDHYYPVAVNIGGVVRDFSSTGGGTVLSTASAGGTATGTMQFSTPNPSAQRFGASVSLSIEGGAESSGAMPVGIGAASISPSTISLVSGGSVSVALSVNGGSLVPGEYPLAVRATGVNSAGQTVTRLIPFTLDIATAATSNQYIDIEGFAVFRITRVGSNTVEGYAISGLYADMDDQALRRGQVARLIAWQ